MIEVRGRATVTMWCSYGKIKERKVFYEKERFYEAGGGRSCRNPLFFIHTLCHDDNRVEQNDTQKHRNNNEYTTASVTS